MTLEQLLNNDTDIAAFIELYRRFGVDLDIEDLSKESEEEWETKYQITLEQGSFFDGYIGLTSTVMFDSAGKFISQGFWE